MRQDRIHAIKVYSFLLLLVSCQNMQSDKQNSIPSSLSSDNGQLDLSLSTLEQQKVEKIKAKQFLQAARQKRTIVEPNQIDEVNLNSKVNIVIYARQSMNNIGKKIYKRINMKQKRVDPCLSFVSADDAQRFFLEKGGPENDFWNLDLDGDGFACDWDPDQYRKMFINVEN